MTVAELRDALEDQPSEAQVMVVNRPTPGVSVLEPLNRDWEIDFIEVPD